MRRATPFVALTVVASVLFLPGQSGIATATCAAAPTAMRAGAQGAPAHVSPARPVRETPRVVNATHYSLRSLRFKGQAVRVLSFTGGQGYGLKQFLTRDHFYNRAGVALSRQLRPLAIAGTSGDFNTTLGGPGAR